MNHRPGARRGLTRALALMSTVLVAASLTVATSEPASAATYGPSTLYTPPADAPTPGSLYARALQLKNSGTANGTMLATFEQYTNGMPVFPVYRSQDSGRTWSKISSVADTVNGWGLRFQPFLYELPTAIGAYPAGTVLAIGNSIPNDSSATKLDVYASTNQGTSWNFVSSIATGGPPSIDPGGTSVWEPFALVNNGRLSVFYADSRDQAHNQKVVHQTTTNLTSWGAVVNDVANPNYADRPGMPVIAALPNGTWIMTYENCGAPEGGCAVYYKISNDPESWQNKTGTVLANTEGAVPGSSPYVAWLPSGGPNGTIAVSTYFNSGLYLNTALGEPGRWVEVPTPVASGYSRALVPLNDGRTLFIIGSGNIGARNTVTYGAVDLGGVSVTNNATYTLVNRNSGLVLGVQNASTADGAPALQWNDTRTADHRWKFEQLTNGYWKIRNANSGKVLGITNQSTANGATALQWSDTGTPDHQWVMAPYPGGGYAFVNRVSGKRLEIGGGSTTAGALAQQFGNTNCTCQVWNLRP